jgi:hypothetical protein
MLLALLSAAGGRSVKREQECDQLRLQLKAKVKTQQSETTRQQHLHMGAEMTMSLSG